MKSVRLIPGLIISVIIINFALAEEEPGILPDDPLYQTKRQMETEELTRGSNPLDKAVLYTRYAKERLAEIKAMISRGRPEFVESLVEDYENAINGAMEEIDRARAQGRNVGEALEVVEELTQKHTEVLNNLLNKVPEEARPAITHAIEVSRHGRTRALEVLNKIQRDSLPVGIAEDVKAPEEISGPKWIIKPERLKRPQGTGRPLRVPSGRAGGLGRGGGRRGR